MMNFCTLFDSNYLDKGLVLYRSLERQTEDFTLYIFCFNDKAMEVLSSMNLKHAVLIHHTAIETDEVLAAKGNRSRAEYCWTCTPVIIEYVLDNYPVDSCVYIDADLYFFQDPAILFHEISEAGANIVVTPHRFSNHPKQQRLKKRYGEYCIQFNYFDQSENGRAALRWWKERCLEWCYCKVEPGRYGDQKYADFFREKFENVHELQNLGGGVAPWNLRQYQLVQADGSGIRLREITTGKEFDIVFYHYQHMRFLTDKKVNLFSGTDSVETKQAIYFPYLRETLAVREELLAYGLVFRQQITHSSNILKALYQRTVKTLLPQNTTDIVELEDIQ